MKQRGFRIKKAKNDVIDGIRFVGSLLNEEKIQFSKECVNTLKEFNSYIWDVNATDRGGRISQLRLMTMQWMRSGISAIQSLENGRRGFRYLNKNDLISGRQFYLIL